MTSDQRQKRTMLGESSPTSPVSASIPQWVRHSSFFRTHDVSERTRLQSARRHRAHDVPERTMFQSARCSRLHAVPECRDRTRSSALSGSLSQGKVRSRDRSSDRSELTDHGWVVTSCDLWGAGRGEFSRGRCPGGVRSGIGGMLRLAGKKRKLKN